ncbi:MAG: PH domain-containing protein [Candidatus Gracilibacteria bacterium]|nr:hypothetical protein [Candidatus Gracilibacteria bacterium]
MKTAYYFFGEYLEKGEKIHSVVHRNLAIMFPVFLKIFIIGFCFPIILLFFFPTLFWATIAWMVMAVMRIFYDLYDWYYYVWLITDRAVIDIRSPSLFEVSTTRIEYHMVEGVSYTIAGFWRTVLGYGDVTLEKVGGNSTMKMDGGNNPKRIERQILKYQEEYMEHHNFNSHDSLKSLLSGMLYEHMKKTGHLPDKDGAEIIEVAAEKESAKLPEKKKKIIKRVIRR